MQCPRCGAENPDNRSACWKCFAQLRPPSGGRAPAPIEKKGRKEQPAPVAKPEPAPTPPPVEPPPVVEAAPPEAPSAVEEIEAPAVAFEIPAAPPEAEEIEAPAVPFEIPAAPPEAEEEVAAPPAEEEIPLPPAVSEIEPPPFEIPEEPPAQVIEEEEPPEPGPKVLDLDAQEVEAGYFVPGLADLGLGAPGPEAPLEEETTAIEAPPTEEAPPAEARDEFTDDHEKALAWHDAQGLPHPPRGIKNEAQYYWDMAEDALKLGEWEEAWAGFHNVLELYARGGDPAGSARSLWRLGITYRRMVSNDLSRRALAESLDLYRKIGDEEGIGILLYELGQAHLLLNDPAAAEPILREAADHLEKVDPAARDRALELLESIREGTPATPIEAEAPPLAPEAQAAPLPIAQAQARPVEEPAQPPPARGRSILIPAIIVIVIALVAVWWFVLANPSPAPVAKEFVASVDALMAGDTTRLSAVTSAGSQKDVGRMGKVFEPFRTRRLKVGFTAGEVISSDVSGSTALLQVEVRMGVPKTTAQVTVPLHVALVKEGSVLKREWKVDLSATGRYWAQEMPKGVGPPNKPSVPLSPGGRGQG